MMSYRNIICILVLFTVTACQTVSSKNPWDSPSYSRPVESAPSPLSQIVIRNDGIADPENTENMDGVAQEDIQTGEPMKNDGQFAFFDMSGSQKQDPSYSDNASPSEAPYATPPSMGKSPQYQPYTQQQQPSQQGLTPVPNYQQYPQGQYQNQQYQGQQQQQYVPYGYNQQSGQTTYQTAQSQSVVRVAVLLPLSGTHADLGEAMLKSAQMAMFDTADEQFQIIPRDTKGTAEGAAFAAQSAINAGASLIIGPLFGHSVEAVQPIAARYNVNVIAFSTDWSLAGGNVYIMGFLPFVQVQRVAEYAASQGISNIGILAPNTNYGNAVIAAYNSLAYRLGLNTATVARFPPDQSDISLILRSFTMYDERHSKIEETKTALQEMLESTPDDHEILAELARLDKDNGLDTLPYEAVLLPVGGEQAISIANLLSYHDLHAENVKRLGTGLWDDPGLASEEALEGSWFSAPPPNLRSTFVKRYQEFHGTRPPRIATLAYDATALASILSAQGMKSTGKPAFTHRDITNPNGFAGLDGIFRFRTDGLIERGLAVLEFKNKKIVVVDPAPTSFQAKNN